MLKLYYHPFASFCQKALIALYENEVPFERELVDLGSPESRAAFQRVWRFAKFPVLRDEARGVTVPESSVIIAWLQHHYPGPVRLIPDDANMATRVHILDRVFDNYVAQSVTKVVIDTLRPEGRNDLDGVAQAKALIATAYDFLENELAQDGWAVGGQFTLADCAAAPALFYSNIVLPFGEHRNLAAYYQRLLARPSFARVVDEARPYRHLFPLAWPTDY